MHRNTRARAAIPSSRLQSPANAGSTAIRTMRSRSTEMPGDRDVDEAVEESFPASDAPANTVETGIVARDLSAIVDNAGAHRFELTVDGLTAFLDYERTGDRLTILHTEVPEKLRGHHYGERLVDAAVASAHAAGLRLVVVCPFARAYLRRHPD